MEQRPLALQLLAETFAVVRLDPRAEVPGWARSGSLTSITRTREELSIVCPESSVPADVRAQRGFCSFRVVGRLDFAEVGVLESLARPLAAAGVSIFVLSTYDTDYLLVPADDLEEGVAALRAAGHSILGMGAA